MKKILLYIVIILFTQCVEEDFFGLSSYGEIKSLEVSNQASQAVINSQEKTVKVEIPAGVDLTSIKIRILSISSFATSDINVGDEVDLTDPVLIEITAEDGMVSNWTLSAYVAASNPQLPDSDFNRWYQTADGYYEPGESASTTIWGTGNPGTKLLGLYPTTPLEREADNLAVRMETLYNGSLPATFGAPISAGSIFTGKFDVNNIDLSDPSAAIDFGIPFAGRPASFKIKYSYVPGAENKDKNGNVLSYGDACDIFILLEVRNESESRRLATAWFRSEASVESLTDLQVEFSYGELPADAPDYTKPPDGLYVGSDSAAFILPTHLTFVASSSYDGNSFGGAVGSLLIIDDLELIYDD
jgi:hypothetical protein